ncbi:MAG: hypothetical protein EOO60_13740 [Hymenobacter sp.]|nr:MAG: hypothetical protein EOO60_13740 [Hymenobacter sp.]
MRFNLLPEHEQRTIALVWTEYTLLDEANGLFPLAYPDTWLAAFRHFNPKVKPDSLPVVAMMERIVNWVDALLATGHEHAPPDVNGKYTCSCCGTKY